jgi:methylenetetrahydrofolate dehydrogenase (NADP+)/methenyltetrahydrofolate cyclohydrolase
MSKILDGKLISNFIADKLKKEIKKNNASLELAIIQIGNVAESTAYIARKKEFANKIGVTVRHIKLPNLVSEEELIGIIDNLNKDVSVNGIIVQMPIPKKLNRFRIMESIDPKKDVDGLTLKNSGLIYESAFGGSDPRNIPKGLLPATAKGIITLLNYYNIPLEGKRAIVVGRSLLVGKPTAMLLIKANATVTIAHSKTKNLEKLIKENDIVIVAVGKPKFLKKSAFKKGAVIVDVGTNAFQKNKKILEEGVKIKLVGDVDFDNVSKVASFLSPVPGGVGPMTVASIFENLIEAYKLNH